MVFTGTEIDSFQIILSRLGILLILKILQILWSWWCDLFLCPVCDILKCFRQWQVKSILVQELLMLSLLLPCVSCLQKEGPELIQSMFYSQLLIFKLRLYIPALIKFLCI